MEPVGVVETPVVPSQRAASPASPGSWASKAVAAKPAVIAKGASKVADQGSLPPKAAAVVASWQPTVSGEIAGKRTREESQAAMEALRKRYEADAPHKHFKTDHHSIVWGEGDIKARLMFVGEAPGEEEDKAGRPFVGRSGQLLDKMIAGMGLHREQVYIANVLKTRPPNNATPTTTESDLCAPYLLEQISIVSPLVIVTLGLPAVKVLLRTDANMGTLRGKWASLLLPDGRKVPVMPTYHPAYVLRSYTDEVRGKVWADLKMAMEGMAGPK